jgi:hypothetical protein
LQDFDEAIKQAPNYGEAYFERSLIYKSLGKKTLWASDLEKAEAFGHKSPEAMR